GRVPRGLGDLEDRLRERRHEDALQIFPPGEGTRRDDRDARTAGPGERVEGKRDRGRHLLTTESSKGRTRASRAAAQAWKWAVSPVSALCSPRGRAHRRRRGG